MWTPIYSVKKREDIIRYTLKHFVFYLIFLLISTTLILGLVPTLRFHFTSVLKSQLIEKQFEVTNDSDTISFNDIRTTVDFWQYFEEVIESSLYTEFWYGWNDKVAYVTQDDMKVLYDNLLLGVPRLRQLRVNNNSCEVHKNFQSYFKGCYAKFSEKAQSKDSFGLMTKTAWVYHESKELNASFLVHYGKIGSYPNGGFFQDLGLTRDETHELIRNLRDNMWISRHTRVVFLDFTLYNANINLFCIIKLIFEFPPTGGILTSYEIFPAYFIDYMTSFDHFILACQFIVILYIVYYTIYEILYMRHYGFSYFKHGWSYIEIIILLGFYFVIGFSFYRFFYINNHLKLAINNPDKYTSYELLAFMNSVINNILAVLLFLLWVKVFRYLKWSRTMGQLTSTLSKSANDILGFSLMFFIIFFAFSQMGYLLFGATVETFSTFSNAVMTLLMTILGEFDYYDIEETNKILAPIFFVTFIFLVFFVLFNMFIAIITDNYSDVKEEIIIQQSELEFIDFLKRAPNKLMKKGRSKKPAAPGNKIVDKIRHILQICGFSEVEITAFFSTHNINMKNEITNDDINKLLAELRHINAKTNSQFKHKKNKIVIKPNITSHAEQQRKIDALEKQLDYLNRKLGDIMPRL